MPSFGVSTVSTKNSLSFIIFSASVIIVFTRRNWYHMTNGMTYKSNVNASNYTFVIIIFNSKPCLCCGVSVCY